MNDEYDFYRKQGVNEGMIQQYAASKREARAQSYRTEPRQPARKGAAGRQSSAGSNLLFIVFMILLAAVVYG